MCLEATTLSAYLDGELMKQQHQEVQLHLADCLNCQVRYRNIETLSFQLQRLPDYIPSADFANKVMQAIEHPEFKTLSAYMDAMLPEAEHQQVETHLSHCQNCQTLCDRIESLSLSMHYLPDYIPSSDFANKVMQAIKAEGIKKETAKIVSIQIFFRKKYIKMAASFALFGIVASVGFKLFQLGIESGPSVPSNYIVQTEYNIEDELFVDENELSSLDPWSESEVNQESPTSSFLLDDFIQKDHQENPIKSLTGGQI